MPMISRGDRRAASRVEALGHAPRGRQGRRAGTPEDEEEQEFEAGLEQARLDFAAEGIELVTKMAEILQKHAAHEWAHHAYIRGYLTRARSIKLARVKWDV